MKVAVLWLINERGEVLLARRAVHIASDAGMWGPSVSGKIDDGETAEQAALREMQEELGLDSSHISGITHLHNSTHSHSDGQLREFTFFYTTGHSQLVNSIRLEPAEVAAVKWIGLNMLQKTHSSRPDTILVGADSQLWQGIFDNLRRVITPGLGP